MKRNKLTEHPDQNTLQEHKQRVAFHEAGHAAGIHLNNKTRGLPPVFFKIIFKDMNRVTASDIMAYQTSHDDCIARVEGGRLIDLLTPAEQGLADDLSKSDNPMLHWTRDYRVAFESDIVNLLIGPLAEAKHVSETDDEPFSHQLIHLRALRNYGGSSDLAMVSDYLHSFSSDPEQRDDKLNELFTLAYNFVNNDANWAAITQLANYILGGIKNIIGCEEIVSMLDQAVTQFENRRIQVRNHCYG
jgi:hypothetical protein